MGAQNAKLHTLIEAPDAVYGLAMLDNKLYVLRQRETDQIYVYETDDYRLQHTFTVTGFNPYMLCDLTECKPEHCLFLSDYHAKCIRKIDANGGASKFVDVPYEPKGLSITPEGNLLVTCNPNKLMEFNAKTGAKIREIELHLGISYPKHAVKRSDGQYVVCHAERGGLSRVCRVGVDGFYRHCFGGYPGPGKDQLNIPCHLVLREDDHVIVADNDNNRLVLLDKSLEYVDTLIEKFREPHRLWFDNDSRRLYVGECTADGSIKVFQT